MPFKVAVKVDAIVEASINRQIRGLNQYFWESWDEAGNYFLANKINLDEALKDEDQSIRVEERYDNLMTKSQVLEAMGRKDDPTTVRNQALGKASAQQLYFYGRQLQGQKKQDEAFALYLSNAKKFPDFWTSHVGLARVYSGQGEFDKAVKEVEDRSAGVPDDATGQPREIRKRLQSKEDFNR